MFNGWCVKHQLSPLTLPLPDFLDLVHYYRLQLVEDPEEDNLLLLGIDQAAAKASSEVILKVEEETGIKKPAWFPDKGITLEQLQAMR